MNALERRMVETLQDLRDNHAVVGVKAEFEAEGTRLEEMLRLKEVCERARLGLTVKVGGCEALRDMYECRVIGVARLVAPMVESAYALGKFLAAARLAFSQDELRDIELAINVETISACQAFDAMLALPEVSRLDEVIMGRVDLTGSLDLPRTDVNSPRVLEITRDVFQRAKAKRLRTVVGGGVSADSLPFFRSLTPALLDRYETRKVIFDGPRALVGQAEAGILKAVGFELMWLKNKRDYYTGISTEDEQRIDTLEQRYRGAIQAAGGLYA